MVRVRLETWVLLGLRPSNRWGIKARGIRAVVARVGLSGEGNLRSTHIDS